MNLADLLFGKVSAPKMEGTLRSHGLMKLKPEDGWQKGMRFGLMTLVEPAWAKDRKGWVILCDCGTKKIYSTWEIRRGKTKSCGCLRRANGHKLSLLGLAARKK